MDGMRGWSLVGQQQHHIKIAPSIRPAPGS